MALGCPLRSPLQLRRAAPLAPCRAAPRAGLTAASTATPALPLAAWPGLCRHDALPLKSSVRRCARQHDTAAESVTAAALEDAGRRVSMLQVCGWIFANLDGVCWRGGGGVRYTDRVPVVHSRKTRLLYRNRSTAVRCSAVEHFSTRKAACTVASTSILACADAETGTFQHAGEWRAAGSLCLPRDTWGHVGAPNSVHPARVARRNAGCARRRAHGSTPDAPSCSPLTRPRDALLPCSPAAHLLARSAKTAHIRDARAAQGKARRESGC